MGERQFLLGLGSNIGNRAEFIGRAISRINSIPGAKIFAISESYDSDPVGYLDQENFLNICLAITYKKSAEDLLEETAKIESELGRVRTLINGPRTIDIDLLHSDEEKINSPSLVIPHPRWKERSFVVYPLRHLLHSPALAKETRWDWLRAEVAEIKIGNEGLRLWNGPTPWIQTTT
jgi:2-amino-4-hydroxy-6-hydroxymethyldihydropteridine diphosphokinase